MGQCTHWMQWCSLQHMYTVLHMQGECGDWQLAKSLSLTDTIKQSLEARQQSTWANMTCTLYSHPAATLKSLYTLQQYQQHQWDQHHLLHPSWCNSFIWFLHHTWLASAQKSHEWLALGESHCIHNNHTIIEICPHSLLWNVQQDNNFQQET